MDKPVIEGLRHAHGIMKSISATVLVAFTMLVLQPTALAARTELERQRQQAGRAATAEEKLSQALQRVQETLQRLDEKLTRKQDVASEKDAIKALRQELRALDVNVLQNFDAVEAQLKAKRLPEEILKRHAEAVQTYRTELAALLRDLDTTEQATDDADLKRKAATAKKRLEGKKFARSQQPFDPNELPFKSQRPKAGNVPKTRKEEFTRAGLHNHPPVKLAALGDFRFDQLAGANDPAYLAETAEVRLSDAVKAKAQELGYDPVKIYHWVRNNIEWLPTWGAVQDADLTLGSRRGNAFDIASLTLALLRASGIPARYVHSTIEVPEARFRNWTGGFADIYAAMDFASSGGIPTTGLSSGGRIVMVRMEHVWVEAAIDFAPSRGAVNVSADAWVALDASYKQYDYQPGLDVAAIANIDGEALAQSFLASGTVNEAEGWVRGFDPTVIQNAQTQAKSALEDYIANQMTDSTVGEVIGGRKTIVQAYPVLPSALPNKVVVAGARYGALPQALQPSIAFAFGRDLFGELSGEMSFPWAALNNRKVTLSFRPATAADEAALQSLLPAGEITDISQLPQNIPAYLIQVVPEIKVDGQTVLSGASMRLGEDLDFSFSVTQPVHGTQVYPSPVVAGSYLSIAVIGGSVSAQRLSDVKAKLEATKGTLESQDQALIAGLTREDILGNMFHAGTLGYFAEYQAFGHLSALQQKSHFNLAPSAGTYGYVPNVTYLFGFPRAITPGGAEMDLDRVATVTNVDGKGKEAAFNFTFQLGALSSALEHAIPEQMFVTQEHPGEGVSAVKALQKAAQQGQRIYHITKANQATTLPNIRQNALTMSEIRNALAVGKEVITHTDAIAVPGWSGAGYVIYDPRVGDGAWKIGGGANGGWLFWGTIFFLAIVVAVSFISGAYPIAGIALYNYNKFLERVEAISASNSSADQKYELLNQAAFLSVISMLNGLLPIYEQLGLAGQALKMFLSGLLAEIGLVWF